MEALRGQSLVSLGPRDKEDGTNKRAFLTACRGAARILDSPQRSLIIPSDRETNRTEKGKKILGAEPKRQIRRLV